MEIFTKIIENVSLWEVVLLLVILYFMFKPDMINRISKFKVGEFEIELRELKEQVQQGHERITELESEIENNKKQFQSIINNFDANASLESLNEIKHKIKAQSKNLNDDLFLQEHLKTTATPEELYAAAVGIREKRPVKLLPDLISLLDELSRDENLGGYRLNTIWTLTSAVHKMLISCVRDDVNPFPSKELLVKAEIVLQQLDKNPKVILDNPNDPMRGIKGPIKHSLNWIAKAKEKTSA